MSKTQSHNSFQAQKMPLSAAKSDFKMNKGFPLQDNKGMQHRLSQGNVHQQFPE
jgi:hypothetical protein